MEGEDDNLKDAQIFSEEIDDEYITVSHILISVFFGFKLLILSINVVFMVLKKRWWCCCAIKVLMIRNGFNVLEWSMVKFCGFIVFIPCLETEGSLWGVVLDGPRFPYDLQ